MTNIKTSALWDTAHQALFAGRLVEARAALDELGRRNDNHDYLLNVHQYGIPEQSPFYRLIQDRIDLVNAKV